MSRALSRMIFNDTDPFYIREILVIFAGYVILIGFPSSFIYSGTLSGEFLDSVSTAFFLIPVAYGAIASGIFARTLERGNMGYLMTFPVRRGVLHIQYALQSAALFSLTMLIPAGILSYLIFDTVNVTIMLQTLLLTFSTLLLFIAAGYFIAVLTRSSAFSAMFVFIVFFLAGEYAYRVFPHYIPGRFLMSGFTIFSSHFTIGAQIYTGALISLLAGSVILLAAYPVLRIRGIRSGR